MSTNTTLLSGGGSSVIDFLKSNDGSYLYPITLTNAIYDLNGNTLETTLVSLKTNIDSHTHNPADINNLVNLLDSKSNNDHTHDYLPLTGGTLSGQLYQTLTESPQYVAGIANRPKVYTQLLKSAGQSTDYGTYLIESTDNSQIWLRMCAVNNIAQIVRQDSSGGMNLYNEILDSGNYINYASDKSHNHNGTYLPYGAFSMPSAAKCLFKSTGALSTNGSITDLEIQGTDKGQPACLTFHIPNQMAFHFGIAEDTSRLGIGGWSYGSTIYDVYTGNYPQVGIQSASPYQGRQNERLWAY